MDSRFHVRKGFEISLNNFIKVMQELLDDNTLEIDNTHSCVAVVSRQYNYACDEFEVVEKISDWLGVRIDACWMYIDSGIVYFLTAKDDAEDQH
ncbi:MAG: hypothetical protein FWE05_12720 [Defluviitaleaceae bacterium]|nr:hypothetical protein [Defluviitaleaceae bacterium]